MPQSKKLWIDTKAAEISSEGKAWKMTELMNRVEALGTGDFEEAGYSDHKFWIRRSERQELDADPRVAEKSFQQAELHRIGGWGKVAFHPEFRSTRWMKLIDSPDQIDAMSLVESGCSNQNVAASARTGIALAPKNAKNV